ncbi:MAG: alpha-hydroxy acid oxidase [Gammaproteobacteria bacterium]|jgi:(S)-mandelate dehydrogenase
MALRRKLYPGRDYRRALSIGELREVARRREPHFAFEYVDSGAEDERTLRRNREAFDAIGFVPRMLVDTTARHQRRMLLGREADAPLVVAPTALNGIHCRDGDLALARAAAAAGVPFCLSTFANVRLERLADEVPGRHWMQLYVLSDRAIARDIVTRAAAAGFEALVVTVDANVFGQREWDKRNYSGPGRLTPRNLLDVLCHPRWLLDVLWPDGFPRFENVYDFLPPEARSARAGVAYLPRLLQPDISWGDLQWIRDSWPRKLLLKGVLSPGDVAQAAELGCDGVVLSNHGGRQLDGSAPPLEMLAEARAAAGDGCELYVDSGFRRGTDVLKAVALGAQGVLIGAATLYGLAAGGEAGVRHAMGLLTTEIDRALGQLGCVSLEDLGPHLLQR